MKKILSLTSICFLSSCFTQQPKEVYNSSSISVLNTVTYNSCDFEIKIYDNQSDFDELQRSIPKTGPRSGPKFMIDFEKSNIAVICKKDIFSYTVDRIDVYKKENKLIISPIPNYSKNEGDDQNLLILEIPKTINTLKL